MAPMGQSHPEKIWQFVKGGGRKKIYGTVELVVDLLHGANVGNTVSED